MGFDFGDFTGFGGSERAAISPLTQYPQNPDDPTRRNMRRHCIGLIGRGVLKQPASNVSLRGTIQVRNIR